MNELFNDFAKAQATKQGYLLAQTLSPVAPPDDAQKLRAIHRSTNSHSVKGDIKHFMKTSLGDRRLSHDEFNGWVEVFVAYWKAIGEINAGESGQVSFSATLYEPLLTRNSHLGPKCMKRGKLLQSC